MKGDKMSPPHTAKAFFCGYALLIGARPALFEGPPSADICLAEPSVLVTSVQRSLP